MHEQEVKTLLQRYREGNCTAEEKALLENWVLFGEIPATALSEPEMQHDVNSIRRRLRRSTRPFVPVVRYAAAALLIIGVAFGFYFFTVRSWKLEAGRIAQTEILPGYNQATLTLADGRTISLDSAQSRIIVGAENIKYDNGESLPGVMLSEAEASHKTGETRSTALHSASRQAGTGKGDVLLQLSTPRGGQYQIILPDGSKVWLNAASTLKYPSKFTGKIREVILEGEAYFSVNNKASAGDRVSRVPFIVKSKNQKTTVLGTEFNIDSYESAVKTTLVTGAIKVANYTGASSFELPASSYKILNPGQQSSLTEAGIQVKDADVESITAWRNGQFQFDDEPLESIMRKVARWYDAEVKFEDESLKTEVFVGVIDRFSNVSKVLNMLAVTGNVSFRVEGKTIFISRK